MPSKDSLRFVMYGEDGRYVAQCLEYDICTSADDKETLIARMDCLIDIELREMQETGQELDRAPERFHNMWDQGRPNYREIAA